MAFRRACLCLCLATPVAAFDFDDLLKIDLTKWWGKDAFEVAVENAKHDVHLGGFATCRANAESEQRVLRTMLSRHQSGGACSELPLAVAQHAWRYGEEQIEACLAHSIGHSCELACKDFPDLKTTLTCDSDKPSLSGVPAENECRHKVDPDAVRTPSGSVRGLLRQVPMQWPSGEVTTETVQTFWGIPYGEQPVRFKAPVAKAKWSGVKTSDDYYFKPPTVCPWLPPLGGGEVSEDCLRLHVYAPKKKASKPRPVFVFLIPGGFIGTNWFQQGWYDAARFVVQNDALFVSVAYRSGFLGHWAHEDLAKEDAHGSMGNHEAMDQRLALQWVQKNIASFGGDPGKVTLAGHSSGAFSVNFHLLSPASRGLFAHGILEGTALDSGWYYSAKEDAVNFYATLGEVIGCAGGAKQIECLRALPVEAFYNVANMTEAQELGDLKGMGKWGLAKGIAAATWSALGFQGGFKKTGLLPGDVPITAVPLWPILPVGFAVDGSTAGLPANPRELYEAGKVNPAKVYMNHGSDEGTIFALIMFATYPWYEAPTLTHAATDEIMTWAFDKSVPEMYAHGQGKSSPFYRMSRAITDSTFLCPHKRMAAALAKQNPDSVFYAETAWAGSAHDDNWLEAVIHRDMGHFVGAWHMNQVKWIFGANNTLGVCNSTTPILAGFDYSSWASEEQRMHELVNCHYALFMHCGSPDATSTTACAKEVLELNSCKSAYSSVFSPRPFPPYERAGGKRFSLTPVPEDSATLGPSEEEERVCAAWDAIPLTRFLNTACRGCARKAGAQTLVV